MNKSKHINRRRPRRSPFLCAAKIIVPVVAIGITLVSGRRALSALENEDGVITKTETTTEAASHNIAGTSPAKNKSTSSSGASSSANINTDYIINVYEDETYRSARNLDEIGVAGASYKFGELSKEKYSRYNQDLLLRLTMAEAGGESIEGKALVIRTIFNRIVNEEFPDTLEEVIYQENQFEPVDSGVIYDMIPSVECYTALDMVILNDWDESQGALYFEATYNGTDTWHTNSLEYLMTVGGHNFYK